MNKPESFILLVEDDHDTAAFYKTLLRAEGMETKCCTDSRQALDFWHTTFRKPDLLILDMRLPDGDGLNLCKMIRDTSHDLLPPVLILSAHGGPRMPSECKKAGGVDYLDKLKDMDRFVDTVKNLLDNRKAKTHKR